MVWTMKNNNSLMIRVGWSLGVGLVVIGVVSVVFRISSHADVYLIDLQDGTPAIEASWVEADSHFSEDDSYVYIKLAALGSEMRSWSQRLFERNERNDLSNLTPHELRDWAERQVKGNPQFAIIVMARIAKRGMLAGCSMPETCRMVVWTVSAHGQGIATATKGSLTASFSGSTLSVSGTATLRYTPPGIPDVSTVDSERLEFKEICINKGPNLVELWKRKLLPVHAISEIESWVLDESKAN
jgi:hypothetical protein